jgi:hypothetical protein
MTRILIFIGIASLLASSGCASPASQSAQRVPFTHGVDLVSHFDMVAILAVVQRDLAKKPRHQPIESVAIVTRRKAIVSYKQQWSFYGEFCIVERCSGGWCITQHKSWNS